MTIFWILYKPNKKQLIVKNNLAYLLMIISYSPHFPATWAA